jgi:hypothetical protein
VNRALSAAVLAVVPLLGGCVAAVQSYPLPASGDGGRALFASIASCAAAQNLEAVKHPDSVNVRAVPGAWVQYMAQGSGFNMVVVVDDASGGRDAVHRRTAAAKQKGDELHACAEAAGPQAIPPEAPTPRAALPDAPPPKSKGMDGFGAGFAGAFDAMGKGFGAMTACTKLTTCRTRLSGELCLGADKSCLDAINSGPDGGPDGCARTLERVRGAAEKYKRRIPGYELPAECR